MNFKSNVFLVICFGTFVCLAGCESILNEEDDSENQDDDFDERADGVASNGLVGTYYDNMDFTSLKSTRVDSTVNFDWGKGSPSGSNISNADTFSVRWTGFVKAQYSQTYTFTTLSDDGVRLWVDNKLIVNNWSDHAQTENNGTIALQAGTMYPIKMEYYERAISAVAKLSWSSPSQAKQIIPSSQLFTGNSSTPSGCAEAKENNTATLSCPNGQTINAIKFASYGTPTGSCPNFAASSCHASSSKGKVEAACLNKQSCSVGANNGMFGDPCSGAYKKLAITYSCSDTGGSCPFPTSFAWTDNTGPLAKPKNGWVALKDFSSVVYNGKHIVYSSMVNGSTYGSQMMVFSNWSDMATAPQTKLSSSTVAPTIFFFAPKKQWILAYQWCTAKFCYATSTDPTNPSSWSFGHAMLAENITDGPWGPIDQDVICDSTDCYLFYAADNGRIFRASMPIADFPGTFRGSKEILNNSAYFEAVQVYAVKGTGKYLMIIETNGSPRSFNALKADSLAGTWTPLGNFASKANVTFTGAARINGASWTDDISHGDLVRGNPDQTHTVDPCNLQLLYQGRDPGASSSNYNTRPYRPGLLTMKN